MPYTTTLRASGEQLTHPCDMLRNMEQFPRCAVWSVMWHILDQFDMAQSHVRSVLPWQNGMIADRSRKCPTVAYE
jgi:hypothetical protein